MRLRQLAPLLCLFLLVGCSTTRVVRLETGQRNAVTFTPRGDIASVALSEEQYKSAVKGLAREAQPSYRALQDARWLFRDSLGARAEGRLGLVSVGPPRRSHLLSEKPSADSQLVGAYVRWCARRNLTGDCLHLMGGGSSLDEDGKRALAFRFAVDSVWKETSEALAGMTDREALVSMLASTGAVYLGLWLLPEPVSKGVAAALTLGLVAWLGWDTVWSLIEGWRVLNDEVRVATTFDQLQAAGEKYGEVMGEQAARAFLMLAMAVLSSSAELAASRMATLPGAHQASLVAAGQGGFRLSAIGEVRSVAVAANGTVTLTLPATAVAMSAQAGGAPARAPRHHIATNKNTESDVRGGPWTPRFQRVFDRARMSLDDEANLVEVEAHQGPHPEAYHRQVFQRLDDVTTGCRSVPQCRELLVRELRALAQEVAKQGTELNRLVTMQAAP